MAGVHLDEFDVLVTAWKWLCEQNDITGPTHDQSDMNESIPQFLGMEP